MYHIIIAPLAERQLRKIAIETRLKIREAIVEIKEDPYFGKPLSRELTRNYSYRIGVYRIIYTIDKEDKIITILTAGHRPSV